MFFRRRGLLFGCGGVLLVCVVAIAIVWFVAIPRTVDALKDGVGESISTVIAEQVNPLYSRTELQDGAEVRFSFDDINRTLQQSNQDSNVEAVEITTEGDRIVMRAALNGQDFDIAFMPKVTSDGRLSLEPVDEGGWWQQQFMDVLGGGMERAVNEWLEANGLFLTGVDLDVDGLVLNVHGE